MEAFLLLSCYCVVADVLYFINHKYLSTLFWVSDIASLLAGLVFCCIGILGKEKDEDAILQEPLVSDGARYGTESERPANWDETVTSYGNVGVFSLFTFSWTSRMLLSFPILNDKLESYRGESKRVTTIMLVKGLIYTARREILLSTMYELA